jgi:hypothetical protein
MKRIEGMTRDFFEITDAIRSFLSVMRRPGSIVGLAWALTITGAGRIADHHLIRRRAVHHDGPGATEGSTPKRDAATDEGARGDPAPLPDRYRTDNKIKVGATETVGTRAKKGPLGNADMAPYHHRGEAQDHHLVADPHMVPNRQVPGEGDVNTGSDHDSASNPSTEQPKR